MIEVRFSTWIKAKSLEDAWEQLRVKLIEVRLGDKLREVFTSAVLEDGEIDSEEKFQKLAERVEEYAVDDCNYHQMKGKEKLWYEKAKEECKKRGSECDGCPFAELCLPPREWKSNPIPEEYR